MNNLKTCIALLLFVCSMNLVSAQKFFKGQLTYNNNVILVGLINMPDTPGDKKIKFKLTESSEVQKIKSELIRFITITSDEGIPCILENIEISKKEKAFCFLLIKGYSSLYMTGQGISTDKYGNVRPTAVYVSGRSLPEFFYMVKRKNEKYLTTIAITSPSKTMFGKAKAFRKMAAEYFKDYPELVKRINNKEFTEENVVQVVSIYNDYMENK
jgi:hypothetical protein